MKINQQDFERTRSHVTLEFRTPWGVGEIIHLEVTTPGLVVIIYCWAPMYTGWAVMTVSTWLRLLISLATWHKEQMLLTVAYAQSAVISPWAKTHKGGEKVAAITKKRSDFFLFLNSPGFHSGEAQQPSWTWKQVECITGQTPSEGWSTAYPAEGDRNTLQTQRWCRRQSKGSTSTQSNLEQGSDGLTMITGLISRGGDRSFIMGRFKISQAVFRFLIIRL